MAIKNLALRGFSTGFADGLKFLPTTGYTVSGEVVVPPAPGTQFAGKTTVFSELTRLIKNKSLNFNATGILQGNATTPYTTLSRISNVLDQRDTCVNRYEMSLYDVTVFTTSFSRLNQLLDDIEDELDYATLAVSDRDFSSCLFQQRRETELEPGFYQGILSYEVQIQKPLSSEFFVSSTTGTTFFNALYKRFNDHYTLNHKVDGFVTTRFGADRWKRPFLFVPEYNIVEDFATTCSRVDKISFEIAVEGYGPNEVDEILNEIDNVYSYCTLRVDNRQFTNMEWMGNSLVELEPSLWRGAVQFEIMYEKDIS